MEKNALVNESEDFILLVRAGRMFLTDQNGHQTDIGEIPSGFVPAGVNGRYFVLTNPNTNEVRFIDPQAFSAATANTSTTIPISDTKPASATQQFEIVKHGNQFWVRDSQSTEISASFSRLDRVNENTFIGHYSTGGADKLTLFQSNGGKDFERIEIQGEDGYNLISDAKVIDLNKWFIIFEITEDGEKRQIVYNGLSGKKETIDFGHLPMEYSLYPQANVLNVKAPDGKYFLYRQDSSGLLKVFPTAKEYDHIAIDAGGNFAVGTKNNSLDLFNVVHGSTVLSGKKSIKIASGDQFTYILDETNGSIRLWIFGKDGKLINAETFDHYPDRDPFNDLPLPQFWEDYESGKSMSVWDINKTTLVWEKSYTSNAKLSLSGSIAKAVLSLPHINTNTIEDLKDDARKDMVLDSDDQEVAFLQGNKVLYVRNKFLKEEGSLYYKKEGKGFVDILTQGPGVTIHINANQTFLLVNREPDGQFYLIDADAKVMKITHDIPAGYVPAGVNGDVFILADKNGPLST